MRSKSLGDRRTVAMGLWRRSVLVAVDQCPTAARPWPPLDFRAKSAGRIFR
jgi:hypothetical protein